MSGTSERGFTLIEVLIALTVISVAFTSLLEILSTAAGGLEKAQRRFENLIVLDRKLKEGVSKGSR